MTKFDQISSRIIKEQELIIGPVAWDEASKVSGLQIVNKKEATVKIEGDGKVAVESLVSRYVSLFGRISQGVCKDAVQDLLADMNPSDVPNSLK